MEFEPAGSDTTRVRFRWEFRPRGIMRVIDPILGTMIRLQFPKDLAKLKALIESGELRTDGRPGA